MTGNKQVLTILIVSGTVQGVFFRAKTKEHADQLGLKGYAKNLPDGTVEICIVGEDIDPLIEKIKKEPPPIHIEKIARSTEPLKKEYSSFNIY